MRIGFVLPDLRGRGSARRVVELANRLTDRGHAVTCFVPSGRPAATPGPLRAGVRLLPDGFADELDVVCGTDELQWHLLERFSRARRRVQYVLRPPDLPGRPPSGDALGAPVDLRLAGSEEIADLLAERGIARPPVLGPAVDTRTFRPADRAARQSILCPGGRSPAWLGTATVEEAGRRIGAAVAALPAQDVSPAALARAYASARCFAVGAAFQTAGQPGLEAMACGVPLVTTREGSPAAYARDGETALVVPFGDVDLMAGAIRRVLEDPALARRLAGAGVELARDEHDWEDRVDELVALLDGVVAGASEAPAPTGRGATAEDPVLSIVTLQWNGLDHTRGMVDSVREHTDVPYELIVVDNGSNWEAASYARSAADHAVLNEGNRGFAAGMNQGLELVRGEYVAFCNNDIVVPPGWASRLVETLRAHPNAGILVPAITAARTKLNVRSEPGRHVRTLPPFSSPPSAVVFVMPTEVIRGLGGWSERYEIASGEDLDLAFAVWVNDLDIVYDSRVLIDHVGKGTASELEDWRGLWLRNRRLFLDIWEGDEEVPRLAGCDPERFARNRQVARGVTGWVRRFFEERDKRLPMVPTSPARKVASDLAQRARPAWDVVWPRLPEPLTRAVRRRARGLGGMH